jgi:hypothetical protein
MQNFSPVVSNLTNTHQKKSSGVDNWYLDEFFEERICGTWTIISYNADNIQLKQMILI